MTNEELVIRIKAGIDVADNMAALWEQNRSFIYKVAKRYQGFTDIEDLVQEGYFGLNDAVERWEQEAGVKFLSYASHWIKQAMVRYVENNSGCVRIPSHQYQRIQQYKQLLSWCYKQYGRKPTDGEIRHSMGLSQEQLNRLKKDARAAEIQSLNSTTGGEDNDTTLEDMLASGEDIEGLILNKIEAEQFKSTIWGLVDSLEETQADIIRSRYQGNMTLDAIGKERGVTRQAIRQQEAKALRTLRLPRNTKQLKPFIDEYISCHAFRGGGVGTFNRTWTSTTEYAALGLIEKGQ